MREADANADGSVTETEFQGLAEKWFSAWDKQKTGQLNSEQMRTG
jgi:hypothetical protein